ncbi:MAG: hypothetical protein HN995_02880 [Candidatus Marinimicrobia bacterium]|nr:hypothetical protein [Candidatus Neomarinimicrobiota bacterium]MBT3575287.1 hypothetical protein [Candidatus Neomarinimicrobiota bacterium]MBT3680386.1 hypothetical protein [Candidatus Neomarinimicrobiota bacterium]MBT3951815.1 hypothetical protein [Candidatus Neomarinimicrobiota bacterium]MBT4252751.1 hypothetical protein [Candidatus Neomarinimicrobiota bacterium]
MKLLIRITLLSLTVSSLLALPRFALMEDVSCGSCHSYQGGGGNRTSYGEEYARESLVLKDISLPWENEESEFPLYFGVDTRYQMIAQADEDLRQFPMQFALYGGAELGSFIAHAEVSRISEEFRVTGGLRYEGLPLESWVGVAKALPVLGWRIDDHSVFTRGGNLTLQGLQREGMPYTPYIESPQLVQMGSSFIYGFDVTLMAGTPFIDPNRAFDAKLFKAAKMSYLYSGDLFTGQIGLAYFDENDLINGSVASWGVSSHGFVWLGEWSQMNGWIQPEITNLATIHQLSYRLFQGLDIVGRYEFFDPDIDLTTGAIQRTSLGLEFFPVRGVEMKLSYRTSSLDLPDASPGPESQILSQIHFYL